MKELRGLGVDFAIYNVVPTGTWTRGSYKGCDICEIDERRKIYREFHDKLAEFCKSNGYKIIDVWDATVGPDGSTKPEYKSDEVHFNDRVVPILQKEIERVFGHSARI